MKISSGFGAGQKRKKNNNHGQWVIDSQWQSMTQSQLLTWPVITGQWPTTLFWVLELSYAPPIHASLVLPRKSRVKARTLSFLGDKGTMVCLRLESCLRSKACDDRMKCSATQSGWLPERAEQPLHKVYHQISKWNVSREVDRSHSLVQGILRGQEVDSWSHILHGN